MNRSGLKRETRWCQACYPSLSSAEVINEKNITPKNDIFIIGDLSEYLFGLERLLSASVTTYCVTVAFAQEL